MNDAKSMLLMYSYAAMKAAEDKDKDTTKAKETKAAKDVKDNKQTKQRGKKCTTSTESQTK